MARYYRSFSSYLKERFGEKVYRVSLDAGFTCPNRDGTLGYEGCAYCAGAGSWNAADSSSPPGSRSMAAPVDPASRAPSLRAQVETGKEKARRRHGARKFIAYFQAYTGTYGPAERLREVYDSVLDGDEEFVALAVGTRPDCVDAEKLLLLASYITRGLEVWVEYGLQTARDETLALIGRGHSAETFSNAARASRALGIKVSAHVIIGLPGEGRPDVVRTAETLGDLAVDGVKVHNLNILAGTRMAEWHAQGRVTPLGLREYASLAVDFLERLPPETVVERLVTDSDPRLLVAPRWSLKKQEVLEAIRGEFSRRESRQGRLRAGE
jgi:radical SAM protein (TIGR01212 family)